MLCVDGGGVWREAGVFDDGGVVGAVQEFGEDGGFTVVEVEGLEVVQFGGDGDEELLGLDEFLALGSLDDEGDAGLSAIGVLDVRG